MLNLKTARKEISVIENRLRQDILTKWCKTNWYTASSLM